MGAVLAYLSVQKKPCKKLILASISPVNTFRFTSFQKFLREHMSVEESIKVAHDILDIQIKLGKLKTSYISIMGEKEKIVKGEKIPDFIVPKTTHRIDKRYIEAIIKII